MVSERGVVVQRLPVKGLEDTGYVVLGLEKRGEEDWKVFKERDLEISQNRHLLHTHTHTSKGGNIAKQVQVFDFQLKSPYIFVPGMNSSFPF